MNNTRSTYYLLLLLPALLLLSCSQEEDIPAVAGENDNTAIVLRVSMPAVEARSTATTVAASLNNGFHISAFCPENEVNGNIPYFEEQFVKPLEENSKLFGVFDQSSEQCVWPSIRHGKQGTLKFFAFYPSREVLRDAAGMAPGQDFELKNDSKMQGTILAYNYRLEKFKINEDITRHIDFVTATAEGSRRADGETGTPLAFEHQLSRIVLQAWGNTTNDIEIAGVRVGGAVIESDFNFAGTPNNLAQGDATINGNWITPSNPVRGCMEYIFREGDTVVRIDKDNHKSAETAAPIMGNAECAMVIPADNPGWNHTRNATNGNKNLYFSVLLRVKEADESNTLVYPYVIGGSFSSSMSVDAMSVVFLSVNSTTGKVVKRVYRNKENNKYYTDPDFKTEYSKPKEEEIRNYGWAAIPMYDTKKPTYRWKPGYQYTYTLNYSDGVGVHDPTDPLPGTPIISKILVGVTEGEQTWPMVVDNFTTGGEVDITDDIIVE